MKINLNRGSFILLLLSFWVIGSAYGQEDGTTRRSNLRKINIMEGSTIHLLSPEPVQYVDISSSRVLGDLPMDNIVRIKLLPDSSSLDAGFETLGPLTIVGDNYIVQYDLEEWSGGFLSSVPTMIEIQPEEVKLMKVPGIGLSHSQMKDHAIGIVANRYSQPIRRQTEYGITVSLNTIHTIGDYIFLDLSFRNSSNLAYTVDELRFSIEDRKITKATNVQAVEIEPLWQLYPFEEFKKSHRNIYVLRKATFPGNKVLKISLTEKQISGRTVNLQIKYKDLLDADSI
ncbi:DUF4138 domain-containing protein [Sphingobacterium lactis]|uniref:DUF4138 domain-containing protein n=1 Tax=Sphingobacterium TaxID=28453 RepID=UPI0021A3929E|nr:DUF4138 domain-containing protein [Sphingobacterium hotanense]MCT1525829.1 DUF4138 domain-containing protein [Sphingobacterium hotanense]